MADEQATSGQLPLFFRKHEDAEEYILEAQPAARLGCKVAMVVGEFIAENMGGLVALGVSSTYRSLRAPFVSEGRGREEPEERPL